MEQGEWEEGELSPVSKEEKQMGSITVIGGTPLQGEVEVSGSKNACLALLAASLLVEGETVLHRVPQVEDVNTMIAILRSTGAKVQRLPNHRVLVRAEELTSCSTPYELVRRMRASFYAAGALLSRLRRAEVALPGGCYIGERPVNYHLDGFRRLGAEVTLQHGVVKVEARRLTGASILLDPRFCSVGTTINLMLASCLSEGETVIENASRDPDAAECARFLEKAGADLKGIGTSTLVIKGVKKLHSVEHDVIPDRIEAGTFLLAGAATKGDVTVHPCRPHHLASLNSVLTAAGQRSEVGKDYMRVFGGERLLGLDVTTGPYPGFPTDLQPMAAVLMCLCHGRSVLVETIFEGRMTYVGELRRMGASMRIIGQTAIVDGPSQLTGAPVETQDIRAGAALMVAGLAAQGKTEIFGAEFIDRGYEGLEEKFRRLGGLVSRSTEVLRRAQAR